MEFDIDNLQQIGSQHMGSSIDHLKDELKKIRAGKASPSMLSGILVDYYNSPTPLSQVANISAPDSKTLSIQPWEKSMLAPIEQAIFAANLGLTPMNDGEYVRIIIPALTEERRKELVRQSKTICEEAKVSLRNTRQKLMDVIKTEVKNGFPEDAGKRKEAEVDSLLKSHYTKIDELLRAKEKDILTV